MSETKMSNTVPAKKHFSQHTFACSVGSARFKAFLAKLYELYKDMCGDYNYETDIVDKDWDVFLADLEDENGLEGTTNMREYHRGRESGLQDTRKIISENLLSVASKLFINRKDNEAIQIRMLADAIKNGTEESI